MLPVAGSSGGSGQFTVDHLKGVDRLQIGIIGTSKILLGQSSLNSYGGTSATDTWLR
jgi:hypothetical protein